jgi:hypothetical protein
VKLFGKKVQRDVCRGAEFARSKFQCSRERLLVHEQKLLKRLLVDHSESQATKFRTKIGLEGARWARSRAPLAEQHHTTLTLKFFGNF